LKILTIGKKNILHWVENLNDALITNAHTVETLFLNELSLTDTFQKNLLKVISKDLMYNKLQNIIERKIESFQPDLIIVVSPFMFNEKIFECFDKFDNIIKYAWIGDRFSSHHKNIANKFDQLFVTDSAFVDDCISFDFPTAIYLPLAVNQKIFYDKKLYRNNNLLFIASYTKQRQELLNQIDSIDMKLVGSKWDEKQLLKNITYINKNISIDDVAEAYNKSKFILNIKHEHNVMNGLNMRTFEAISAGGCLLQDYVSDVELNFEIDKDILVYKNLEELNYLIEKLQKDKEFYKNIISYGEKLVSAKHTYNQRIESMLECFKG